MLVNVQGSLKEYSFSNLLTPFLRVSDQENQWKVTYHRSNNGKKEKSTEWVTIKVIGIFCTAIWKDIIKDPSLLERSFWLEKLEKYSICISATYENYQSALSIIERRVYLPEETQRVVNQFFAKELVIAKKTDYPAEILAQKIAYLINEGIKSENLALRKLYEDLSTTTPSDKIYKILFNIMLEKYCVTSENPNAIRSLSEDLEEAGCAILAQKATIGSYNF